MEELQVHIKLKIVHYTYMDENKGEIHMKKMIMVSIGVVVIVLVILMNAIIGQAKMHVKYTSLGVPNINSSFKTYMDYRAITNKNSAQYKFIHKWGWCDNQGFMRCGGERNLGIKDDYYLIALGSYYGTEIGTKYRITTNTGKVFYGALADCKSNRHTDSTNQYVPSNKNVVEFVVDTRKLNKNVKYHGSANVYMPLNGSVVKIERIDFAEE